ncbi:MAG: tetratricopeptide repeat protein [Thermoanaerobaculia bacterium]
MRPRVSWRLAAAFVLLTVLVACSSNGSKGVTTGGPSLNSEVDFGVSMAKRGLWAEALFRFQQADMDRPNDPEILNNMAVAYEAVGNFEEALDTYKRALQAGPTNSDLKRNYSAFIAFYQSYRPDAEADANQTEDGEAVDPDSASEGAK